MGEVGGRLILGSVWPVACCGLVGVQGRCRFGTGGWIRLG